MVFGPERSKTGVRGHRGHFPGSGSRSIFDLLMLLGLWGCGHRSCDVHKSTGCRTAGFQVDLSDALGAVVDVEDSILGRRSQSDGLLAKGLADADVPVLEGDHAADVGFANDVPGAVGDGWQLFAEGAWAGLVACSWRVQTKRLVRPLVVVDVAPFVEGVLAGGQIGIAVALENLGLGAMAIKRR